MPDRDNLVRHQDVGQAIQVLEVGHIDLVDVAGRQIFEADIEAVMLGAAARATGVAVWLDRHQQGRVEAFRLAIPGIDFALFMGGAPGQRPGRVGHKQGGRAIGMARLRPPGGMRQKPWRWKQLVASTGSTCNSPVARPAPGRAAS